LLKPHQGTVLFYEEASPVVRLVNARLGYNHYGLLQ